MTATVISECIKGFCFCETDETHQSLFVHIRYVKDGRCLHIGDRITLDAEPNPRKPGQMMAVNVTYIGRVNNRKTSAPSSSEVL